MNSPLTVGGGGTEDGANSAGRPRRNRFGFDPLRSFFLSYQNNCAPAFAPGAFPRPVSAAPARPGNLRRRRGASRHDIT